MNLSEELAQLEQMHQRGTLSEAEFAQAKNRLLQSSATPAPRISAINNLRRSATDRWLGGVCGGLATFTGMESWLWRLLLALTFLAGGIGVVLYLLLWIFVPLETNSPQPPAC
ncbi:MAG: PspC domain-containing protein [Rhodoferax sp.]|uniref:PspC domain-containing protein n=1 Tax=Rhodoferax sp. TaxID=50421 RepID=UPI00261545ED|nr:PspC domain-containing protein [Rhodoferax sp.]MDD5333562.1 PspC domain-containing protein [Rhodoferax sp.]